MMKRFTVTTLLFWIILVVAFVLRFYQLGNIPYGITNDEASYIYSSYSLWHTGKGIDGTFLPLSFNTDSSNSPVPIYIDAPFVGLLGVSPFSGRLPYALAGFGSVILVYFIAKKLFKNEWIALLSMMVIAISPWHLHMSRAAIDAVMALFFYLLGTYLLLKNQTKKYVLFALIAFLLGFYSYHAMKFFFVFFIPFLGIVLLNVRKNKTASILYFVGYCVILASFLLVSTFSSVTRQEGTVLSLSDGTITQTVDFERTTTLVHKIAPLFNNKILTAARIVRENFLEPFSPQYLFLYGDTNSSGQTLGLFNRGVMYIIELPLLLYGLLQLFYVQNKKNRYFIVGGLICAVLPSTFVIGKTFAIRDMMMIPFLSMIVGLGIYAFVLKIQKLRPLQRKFILFLFVAVYVFLFSSYLYQYYARYPIYGAQAWLHDRRDLAQFIYQNKDTYDHIYVVNREKIFLAQYGIFGKVDPRLIQAAWQHNSPVGNIQFNYQCIRDNNKKLLTKLPPHTLYITFNGCNTAVRAQKYIRSVAFPDQTLWRIYER